MPAELSIADPNIVSMSSRKKWKMQGSTAAAIALASQ